MDPIKDVVTLLARTVKKRGVRPLARTTKIPKTTILNRVHAPGTWKLAEVKRVLDACALNDRLIVRLASLKTAPVGQSVTAEVARIIHRQTPKKQPPASRVPRRPHRHPAKASR